MSRNQGSDVAQDNPLYPGCTQPCLPAPEGRRSGPKPSSLREALLQLVGGSMRGPVPPAAKPR